MTSGKLIEPFIIAIPEAQLDELRARIDLTRWVERETVDDWSQGVPLATMQALVRYWRQDYDWRRCETQLNALGQYRTEIDGLGLHFLHVRSPEPDALPLIMTHGWPGSVIEFLKVIGPLTDPVAHGGRAEDAFHLVIPSLPGYGFSDRPTAGGWSVDRIAVAWVELMRRLGYGDRWAAQGGDWGCAVTASLGQARPEGLIGIHLNVPFIAPPSGDGELTDYERAALADRQAYDRSLAGYALQQATRPQTIGYSLADSPVGQAAWIYEKFHDWTDHRGTVESILTMDEVLDNIMLYWLTGTGASSARLYWESLFNLPFAPVEIPSAITVFPRELHRASRRWVEPFYPDLRHFGTPDRGGHFAAFEQPAIFVDEVRLGLASMR